MLACVPHAQGIRRIVRSGARPTGTGPAERISVSVFQSHAHALESAGVGWQRIVGMREALGEGPLPLAGGERKTAQCHDACRGTGDAGEWARSEADAAAQMVPAFRLKSSGTRLRACRILIC